MRSPEDLEHDAACWEGACCGTDPNNPNDPAGGRASDFNWREELAFPIENLIDSGTNAAQWAAFLDEERRLWEEDKCGRDDNRIVSLEKYWLSNPNDPVIIVLGRDGLYTPWDGNHRIAISIVYGRKTIHAVVGTRK